MNNRVIRKLITTAASGTFVVNEKRDFTVSSIKFLSGKAINSKKSVTVTVKHDGITTSFEKSFTYYSDYVFTEIHDITLTKDSTITVDFAQTNGLDEIKMYAEVDYIGDILDYILNESNESLVITTV
jgi:hypothetical protein